MRIALTGTHSTGKTTLINRLALREEFKGYHVSYSNTRALKEKGLPINCNKEEDFDTTQELVLTFHLKDLLKPKLLADRCLVDGLAYTQYLHSRGQVSVGTMELFGQLSAGFLHHYDFIFYSPIRGRAEDDGVRDLDESFRLGVDLTIKENLISNIQNCYILPSEDIEENIQFIIDTITQKKS